MSLDDTQGQRAFPDPPFPSSRRDRLVASAWAGAQWWTSPDMAARMVEWASPAPGDMVIEPSAGDGVLVRNLRVAGVAHARLVAVEIDPRFRARLEASAGTVHMGDFLELAAQWRSGPAGDARIGARIGRFDLACMNPPDRTDNPSAVHVLAAARIARRVVALVRTVVLQESRGAGELWAHVRLVRLRLLRQRPRFEPRTDGSPRSAWCLIEVAEREQPRDDGEIDPVAVEWM